MSKTTWKKIGALGGIAFVVLQLTAQGLIQIGGAEPAFNATAQEILDFFTARNKPLFVIGGYLSTLSIIAFLWFLGSLWGTLKHGEGDPAWMSLVAVASGLFVMAPIATSGGWALAIFRIGEGLDPQLARLLFDQGNYAFATLWVFVSSFLVSAGVVILQSEVLPKWLAWFGFVIAVLSLVSRAFWTYPNMIIFMPYTLFWVWLIAASIALVRHSE